MDPQPVSDRFLRTDSDRDTLREPLPPESVALGPGCAIRFSFPGDNGRYDLTVHDRHGNTVAHGHVTVERTNHAIALGPSYTVTVTDLTTPRGRGRVLPVRADSDPKPEPYGEPSIRTVHHAVHHFHGHSHPHAGAADALRDALDLPPGTVVTAAARHAHVHVHTGADADRAGRPGHRSDPHEHAHKRYG